MLSAGDVERNPGPRYKFPCTVCAKPVTSVQQGIGCSKCGMMDACQMLWSGPHGIPTDR